MSLLGKIWQLQSGGLAAVLERTLDDATVTFHDPFLLPDMEKAVDRLQRAMKAGERVVVFGDYDVDGISGTAILVHALRELGGEVSYRLPDRQDGYGLRPVWVDRLKAIGISVLITVDCGISNAAEIEALQNAGIDVIVTDHHALPGGGGADHLPKAYAILHPRLPNSPYPFHELSGSGMAYKLAMGLFARLRPADFAHSTRTRYADLASLGTVGDCVPLIGENRWIVKTGLDQMRRTEWPGLAALLKVSGVEFSPSSPPPSPSGPSTDYGLQSTPFTSDLIGFRIGPRLNAAGRLETPYFSLQLLLDEDGKSNELAEKLESLNNDRKDVMNRALEQAEADVARRGLLDKKILIAWSADWPAGIIGLLAGRLAEKYNRPAIIMEERGAELVGSCRSPGYFNIVEALQAHPHHFRSFGGHAAAAGFTLSTDNLARFLDDFEAYAHGNFANGDARIPDASLIPNLTIDAEVTLADLTLDLARDLAALEPYGVGNERPRFLLRNVKPVDLQTVGREQSHVRFMVGEGSRGAIRSIPAIAFRFGDHFKTLQTAIYQNQQSLDVVFELERNVWNGKERIQLKVVDLRIS